MFDLVFLTKWQNLIGPFSPEVQPPLIFFLHKTFGNNFHSKEGWYCGNMWILSRLSIELIVNMHQETTTNLQLGNFLKSSKTRPFPKVHPLWKDWKFKIWFKNVNCLKNSILLLTKFRRWVCRTIIDWWLVSKCLTS